MALRRVVKSFLAVCQQCLSNVNTPVKEQVRTHLQPLQQYPDVRDVSLLPTGILEKKIPMNMTSFVHHFFRHSCFYATC